jgi:hypothetical protein
VPPSAMYGLDGPSRVQRSRPGGFTARTSDRPAHCPKRIARAFVGERPFD